MSKWLKQDAYEMFATEKSQEADSTDTQNSSYRKWKNPQMGTQDRAKEYKVRLLPDPKNGFYKKYFYHGFTVGEKFQYILCEKTFDMDAYCPWCDANKVLYQGNDTDKKKAADYKRKERFVTNVFIIDDPRDVDVKDDAYKVNGTNRLYEFPATVESKIRNEITDRENGYGMGIFDPENGYDFILKIKAKPKDKNGKEWPDYGDTMFARRASAMCDDIDKAMESRYALDDYIESMKVPVSEHEKLLKAEMLWDDVSANFNRYLKGDLPTATDTTSIDTTPSRPAVQEQAPEQPSEPVEPTGDDDTDALLAELQDM